MEQKFLLFLLALLPTFIILHLLNLFFGATGLGRILVVPLIFCINIIIIIAGLTIASYSKKIYKGLVWGVMVLVTVMIPLFLWEEENSPNAFKQIEYSISAIRSYNHIPKKDLNLPLSKGFDYDSLSDNNIEGAPERYVVALYKYRHQVPLDGSYHIYREDDTEETSIKSIDEIPSKLEEHHKVIWWILERLKK